MIAPTDLAPVDADLARRILVTARSIAPCLDTLDGEAKSDAIAILKGVALAGGVPHGVKSQRIASAAVEYNASSWWSADDRAGLRSLCAIASSESGYHPIGEFPTMTKVVSNMFPEEPC